MNDIYISDVNKMNNNLIGISNTKNNVVKYLIGLNDIINQIDKHWISDGEDKITLINNLNLLQEKFSNELMPVLEQFINTMNSLVTDSVNISNNT